LSKSMMCADGLVTVQKLSAMQVEYRVASGHSLHRACISPWSNLCQRKLQKVRNLACSPLRILINMNLTICRLFRTRITKGLPRDGTFFLRYMPTSARSGTRWKFGSADRSEAG